MSELVRYGSSLPGFLQTRTERQTNRALEVVRSQQAVVSAQQVGAVQIIAETTEAALLATSHISVLESLLANRTPQASERLRHIADGGALGMTEVVLSTNRRCR